ncbi:MAG: hypothetical protein U5N58_08535 [Actinomycetota bacterium]|nr:hypothetical protein [Actinomycetota bacterium]
MKNMDYAKKIIEIFGSKYYITGVINCSTFEGFKYLRGMAQSLMDLAINKDIGK